MSNAPKSSTTSGQPKWSVATVLNIIGQPHRWKMLEYIVQSGKPQMTLTLAKVTGLTPSACSKHLAVLRDSGILVCGDGRLYDIAPSLHPPTGEYDLKFGFLTLHFAPPA